MYELAIMKAVTARWAAASLDSSICQLFPAGDKTRKDQRRAGSPVVSDYPRAQYYVDDSPPMGLTRGSRVGQALVTIQVFEDGSSTTSATLALATHLNSIGAAFIRSDETTLSMVGGDILECESMGSYTEKVDDNVAMGQHQFRIKYVVPNTAPSS